MAVKLTVERKVIPGSQGELTELLRELRSKAVRQPGFISGETVVDAFNPTIFMTISIWATLDAWQTWERSAERLETVGQINELIQETPKVRVWADDIDAPPSAI